MSKSFKDDEQVETVAYLTEKQQELENRSIDRGRLRFNDRLQKNLKKQKETASGAARNLLRESLIPVEQGIAEIIRLSENKRGPKPVYLRIFSSLGSDVTAYLTGIAILDSISSRISASKMCLKIAGLFIDELKYRRFKEAHPGLFDWKLKNFDTTSYVHMKRSLDASMLFAQVDVTEYELDVTQRILVGAKALDIFVAATGYVEIRRTASAQKKSTTVVATQETVDWINRTNAFLESKTPITMPTLIPPRPWGQLRNEATGERIPGGYWFGMAGRFPIMRTYGGRNQLKDLDLVEMPAVYAALNALQNTSYHINQRVLATMEAFKDLGEPVAGLPSYVDTPLPPQPADMDSNPEARKNWRRQAHLIHDENHERKCEAIRFSKILTAARLLLEETDTDGHPLRFYFPHNLDFRGRAYAIPVYLQPQGDDICRSLLVFGEGKALGSLEAVEWLAIHGANQLGKTPQGESLDKSSFESRVQWIEDHTQQILDIADDPINNRMWMEADEPWQFLAFCFEWTDFIRSGRSLDFVSSIPVSMDGSCNGLQHYAALMRDEELAKAVNLLPSDSPSDIYRTVAQDVMTLLKADALSNSDTQQMAVDWLTWGKVDRKFVKRQVMTLPYGSKKYGFREQIKEYLRKLDTKDRPAFFTTASDGFRHCGYMSEIVWQALSQSSGSAMTAMSFFQACARLAARNDAPILWTVPSALVVTQAYPEESSSNRGRIKTMLAGQMFDPRIKAPVHRLEPGSMSWTAPSGLPVVQAYSEELTKPINNDSILGGKIFRPRVTVETAFTLDKSKQVSGIAPNIIHSLDAAAMMLTVRGCLDSGLTHFLMIHDSFGTHASDAPLLASLIRSTFVAMYETDVLSQLHRDLTANIDLSTLSPDEAIPDPPQPGNLDLSRVLDSKYFFA